MRVQLMPTLVAASIALALGAAHAAPSPHWVRVEADRATVEGVGLAVATTADYGRFQWLPLDDAGLARVQAAGLATHEVAAPFVLDLGGERFDPLAGVPDFAGWGTAALRGQDGGEGLRLVQFSGPVRQGDLDGLRAAGLEPLQYVHPFTYVAWGTAQAIERSRARTNVRWSGDFLPAYRVLPRWRTLDATRVEAHVLVYRGAAGVDAALAAAGAPVIARRAIDGRFAVVDVRVAGDALAAVAAIPGVYSVQPVPTDGGLRGEMSNQVNAGNIGAGNLAFPGYLDWLDGVGLDGSGVILADVDGGIYDTHPDLANRMLPCIGDTCGGSAVDAHGTHTAGIMAADGSSGVLAGGFLRGLGMAPGANLVEQLYSPTFTQAGGMLKLMTDSVRNGASGSGNSWGPAGSPRGYDGDTRQVDVGVRDADPAAAGDQPLFYVLSAMNGNGGTSSQGTPDEGKNLFAIGSTWMQSSSTTQNANIDDISANSSHGPALDGRILPAMVAPGCSVDSSASASGYALMCGTSMASPHVTGASALFIERYRNLTGSDPSPALLKAAFTAVAKDLTGHDDADGNPITHLFDNKQGWGRMQVAPVVAPAQAVAYVDQERVFDDTGEAWSRSFLADDPAQPIRVMLTWTDAPGHGLGGSTPAWNNNLDLRVAAGSATFLGNVLDANGWSSEGGSADPRNNTEGVFLQPAQHGGAVTIEVLAADINSDALPNDGDGTDQDFALVCYNCVEQVASGVDLALSAQALAPWAAPGQPLSYELQVTNQGSADASSVRVTLAAEDLGAISTPAGQGWLCGTPGPLMVCHYKGTLAAGAMLPLQLALQVDADPADPVVATFEVDSAAADQAPADNTAVVATPVVERLFADGFDGTP